MKTNLDLNPAEIIYIINNGRIVKHLKDIVKLTFYFLVLKKIILLEQKLAKRPGLMKEEQAFFLSLNEDKLSEHILSNYELKVLSFIKDRNHGLTSLEQFWDLTAEMLSDKFRLFSIGCRIEDYIKRDLLDKHLLITKSIKLFNFTLIKRTFVSSQFKNHSDIILKNLRIDDYKSIMRLTGIDCGNFFETETYLKINNFVDSYIDRFLLMKGGWVVAPMALFGSNYPEPIALG
jgi:hypothetical protein